MAVRLIVAPAGAGKTAYVLRLAQEAAQDLQDVPWVCVPTYLQARAFRRRLAQAGGAVGVQVQTFDGLYRACLVASAGVYTELSEPVQFRLLRAVVDQLPLVHYRPLQARPGFVHVLQRLISELKEGRVDPERFAGAVAGLGDEPRLAELAAVYRAYQERLQRAGWADRQGLGWLAVEALERQPAGAGPSWPLLIVDGFDRFSQVQMALLWALARRVGQVVIALGGDLEDPDRPLVYRRFQRTGQQVEAALGVQAEPLPAAAGRAWPLAHLERGLLRGAEGSVPQGQALELLEAPDRAGEARAALRWLKARLVQDGLRPGEVALLARSLAPYRPFLLQTAREFGLPLRLAAGLPLRGNPAVAALLDLLRLALPGAAGSAELALPRRQVVEAWRSPYFAWSVRPAVEGVEAVGIGPADADALDAAARWGRVIGGEAQWAEALSALAGLRTEEEIDEERGGSALADLQRAALQGKFRRFVQRIRPPAGARPYRDFVAWLEDLIGPDPATPTDYPTPLKTNTSLEVVACARRGDDETAAWDVAALQAFKDVLRGLVWAEAALGLGAGVEFPRFFEELVGVVEASTYQVPMRPDREEIVAAEVGQARGLHFRAVALVGCAEGEFPAALHEDPFLRDADRTRLQVEQGLPLELSTESDEAQLFYESVSAADERLLLTRPRLAEGGAPWEASPYWEDLARLAQATPQHLMGESAPDAYLAASWPELLESLASRGNLDDWAAGIPEEGRARVGRLRAAVGVLVSRQSPEAPSPLDGDLSHLAAMFAVRFGPQHTWSPSRLESYRACPFWFFVANVLGLEPREEPDEGLDGRQLGNI
ncbi:MAG: hypothetical protein GX605_04535, partial [Chloroflexi bacterium]|nr:hypothetical protein [Chloroflexota bacterium]